MLNWKVEADWNLFILIAFWYLIWVFDQKILGWL